MEKSGERTRRVARIEQHETPYLEYQYGVLDLKGRHWLFARHARDVSQDAWGAVIATALP
jgi:hypothetical protein